MFYPNDPNQKFNDYIHLNYIFLNNNFFYELNKNV